MNERTFDEALRSYPTSGRLGAGEEQAPSGQQHVSAQDVQDAVRGVPQVTEQPIERTLKVDGKEVKLTLTPTEEAALLQKGLAADERFREAADLRKQAEQGMALRTDLEQIIKEGDVDAFRRMGATMGIPATEVEAAAQKIWGDGSEDDEWEDREERPLSTQRTIKEKVQDGPVPFNKLDPQVQRLLLRQEKARIDEIIGNALDKNETVRYNMEQYDSDGQKAIRQLVEEKVRGRLSATNGDFGDGSQILPEVLREIEATLKALGSSRRSLSPLGMGPAPGGGDPGIYPKKKPDHVSSRTGAFEDSIQQTIEYHLRNAQST